MEINVDEKEMDYQFEGSVLMDSQHETPEEEFLDQIDSEAFQQVTMGSPVSISKL
jgi:hypothetical protein